MVGSTMKKTAYSLLNVVPRLFGKELIVVDQDNPHYHIFDSNMLSAYWKRDEEIVAYETSLHRTDIASCEDISKRFRYYSLYQNAVLALNKNLEGDVAECGVWRGHSAHMLASILQKSGFCNKFLIFDSFQGLSDLVPLDINERFQPSEKEIIALREMLSCPEHIVRANLSEFDFIEYYAGWIPTRFPEVADRQFILVHLDVDLYEPYRDSIEFFFPRLVSGGAMVFDDYGFTQFPGAKTAVDEAMAIMKPSFFYKIPSGGAFLIK